MTVTSGGEQVHLFYFCSHCKFRATVSVRSMFLVIEPVFLYVVYKT